MFVYKLIRCYAFVTYAGLRSFQCFVISISWKYSHSILHVKPSLEKNFGVSISPTSIFLDVVSVKEKKNSNTRREHVTIPSVRSRENVVLPCPCVSVPSYLSFFYAELCNNRIIFQQQPELNKTENETHAIEERSVSCKMSTKISKRFDGYNFKPPWMQPTELPAVLPVSVRQSPSRPSN